ncbi:MAG: RCC1 domain-containing protein [Bradymonadaceae bacterium]
MLKLRFIMGLSVLCVFACATSDPELEGGPDTSVPDIAGPDVIEVDADPLVPDVVSDVIAETDIEEDVSEDIADIEEMDAVADTGPDGSADDVLIEDCPEGCAPSESCIENVCVDICELAETSCGTFWWSGEVIDCGGCTGVLHCAENQCIEPYGYRGIVTGVAHTCALRPQGGVRCWGRNEYGQIGNNTMPNTAYSPATVFDLTTAAAIDSTSNHVCVSRTDGQVRCWGYNPNSQLGNRATADAPVPVEAHDVASAVGIATGGGHTCAVLNNGEATCWGYNGQGQLGNGEVTAAPGYLATRVMVRDRNGGNFQDLLSIRLGSAHSCGLREDGSLWCWGFNQVGQLGQGDYFNAYRYPSKVANLEEVIAFGLGLNHGCAVTQDGKAKCWGEGSQGQLGYGQNQRRNVPIDVTLSSPALRVAAGWHHSCAITADRRVHCWGSNASGQLGDGTTAAMSSSPRQVQGLEDVLAIAAGAQHTCAVKLDGSAYCWGDNSHGQLATQSIASSNIPVRIP